MANSTVRVTPSRTAWYELSCRNWISEAALRMLLNKPDAGGSQNVPRTWSCTAASARPLANWEAFDQIVAALRRLGEGRNAADPVPESPSACSAPIPRRRASDRQLEPRGPMADWDHFNAG